MVKSIVLLTVSMAGLAAQDSQPADWQGWLKQGVQAFKNARYDEAITAFQRASDLDASEVMPHLYLAMAYLQKYVPGSATPEMQDAAWRAESEFQRVLILDANNRVALASLGSLNLNQRKWGEARDWYQKLIGVDPENRDAYYTLGFIAWSEWYPAYGAARSGMGLRPEQPGPMPDGLAKEDLKSRFGQVIEDGMANLRKALEIDPKYDDAMAYMNLFIRERADLCSTREEYRREVAEADQWVGKALATKKEKAGQVASGGFGSSPPPPPPPPPPATPPGSGPARAGVPPRIIIAGGVQQSKIVNQVPPVYPDLARQARIQGTVNLTVVVQKDGSVGSIQVNRGHPLLVPPALDAVKQWKYQTTLLNGEPVEVQTTVDVDFTLPD